MRSLHATLLAVLIASSAGTAHGQAPAGPPAAGRGGAGITVASDTTARLPVIMREEFEYERDGRRDPFFSLMSTAELRPTLSDLRLTGITYSANGRSVATLRDPGANKRYTAQIGTVLGRMRVVAIRPNAVIFSIEEFGMNRRDSLVLNDSTKVRP